MIETLDIENCWQSCQNAAAYQCNWFSFSDLLKYCVQFQYCFEFEEEFGDYITNQVECDLRPSGGKTIFFINWFTCQKLKETPLCCFFCIQSIKIWFSPINRHCLYLTDNFPTWIFHPVLIFEYVWNMTNSRVHAKN